MKECIERDAAMDLFATDLAKKDCKVSYQGFCIDAVLSIGNLPAADVQPFVRGEWIEDYAHAGICSVCRKYAFETSLNHHISGWFPNFCPNCGAKMNVKK